MRLWRESAAYKREEEAERIGELIGAGYAEDRGQMTPERRAYPLELFRLEVVRGDYFRRDGLRVHGGENGSSPCSNYPAVRWTAQDKGSRRFLQTAQVSSHCCAPASAGFFSLSASSSASRSSAGLTRPLCLKKSAPERS